MVKIGGNIYMINERKKRSVTHGMANATKDVARQCDKCGLKIPVYPGAYPKSCPDCSAQLNAPSVDEQIAMVRAGIPAREVVMMTHPDVDVERMDEILGRIKAHVQKHAGDIKKHASTFKSAGQSTRKRTLGTKLHRSHAKVQKAKAAVKKKPKSKKAVKKLVKASKSHQAKKTRLGGRLRSMTQTTTKHEAIIEQITSTELAIRNSIFRCIEESGHADLSVIARNFKANPISVYNLAVKRRDEWGLLVGGNGYKVYPRRSGDYIRDDRRS